MTLYLPLARLRFLRSSDSINDEMGHVELRVSVVLIFWLLAVYATMPFTYE